MKKKLLALGLITVMMGMMLTGCGSKPAETAVKDATKSADASKESDGKLEKVKLQLKWLPQSQFMGYYVAAEKGYYKDEGIDIEILPGGSDIIPEQNVYNGAADIGVISATKAK